MPSRLEARLQRLERQRQETDTALAQGLSGLLAYTRAQHIKEMVSDHRGSNSQVIDFARVEIYPIFTAKIKKPEKSNT